MPPKKATASSAPTRKSSRAAPEQKPTTNGVVKAAPKKQTKSSTTAAAATTKTTTSKPITKKMTEREPVNKSNKRKADSEEPEPQVNGNKRVRKDSKAPKATDDTPAQKRKVAAAKKPATKKPRTSAVINHAPAEPLNVYVFGDGTNGELGLGNGKGCSEVKRPRLNPHLPIDTVGVVQVSVGGMHTAVLTKDNKILTWGVNDQGALGRNTDWDGGLRDMDDDKSDSSDSDSGAGLNPKESTPGEVDLSNIPSETIFTQLACTDSATFALTNDGHVYGTGTFRGNEGIFGFSSSSLVQRTLTLIPELKKITQLAAGANHVLALDLSGHVFAWGSGQQNQLGRKILERFLKNSLVPSQCGLKHIAKVGAGAYHSFAIKEDGTLMSWGLNSFGETGQTENFEQTEGEDAHMAKPVPGLEQFGTITQIEGGSHHTIARTDKNEVLVWGRLDGYQLGIKISDLPDDHVIKDSAGNPRILRVPTQVPGIEARAVAAGSDHSIAIAVDGRAYAWGFSTGYQTGLGKDEEVEVAEHIDNTATRGKHLVWAGAGGQFSVIAGKEVVTNGVNGH